MDSYCDHPSWHRYKAVLDTEFGLTIPQEPREHWENIAGHDIHIDEWGTGEDADPTEGARQGTVILVHGGGGNGRVLAPFAQVIANSGWRVLAPDLPGFGLSRPAEDWRGDYDVWPEIIAELADRQEGPVVLFGASMGGLTAFYAAQAMRRAPRFVVATTLLDLSSPGSFVRAARWRLLGWLSLFSARLLPWLMDRITLPLKLAAPLNAMSANRNLARYFQTDPLLGARWVPLRFWRTAHRFRPKRLDLPCPLLLVHPGADAWTAPKESLATFKQITSAKRYVLLKEGSHLPVEPGAFAALMQETEGVLREASRASPERSQQQPEAQ